jgi:AcrR family transcriptional regulator
VGVRGRRTQQRILDAALVAFAEHGYHRCSVERITRLAGCSRIAFYQYFPSKEHVFRELAARVARQVRASTEALGHLTDDRAGRAALHAWVARYAEIHERHAAVFHSIESDEALAELARRAGDDNVVAIQARVVGSSLTAREIDAVLRLSLECVNHALDVGAVLQPRSGVTSDRMVTALTDAFHRTLFGPRPGVNDAGSEGASNAPPATDALDRAISELAPEPAGVDTGRERLLDASRDVFVVQGFHATRVDDLTAAAGLSRAAFYKHFRNKEEVARVLTARAAQAVGDTVRAMPSRAEIEAPRGAVALRRWLRAYHAAHTGEAVMLRVWTEATLQDPSRRGDLAPLLDWGRRRMLRFLDGRSFGDRDADAIVLLALLGVFGARPRSARDVDAAAQFIRRGLLAA